MSSLHGFPRTETPARAALTVALPAVLAVVGAPGGVAAASPPPPSPPAVPAPAAAGPGPTAHATGPVSVPSLDPLHTIDGCSGGRILAPRVPIYDAHPEREEARRIGWLRGTHRRDLCRGTVVVVRERVRVRGRTWVLVEPIEGPGPGWVHGGFLGSPFPRWKCDWRFEGEALQRCLEA